MRPAKIIQRDQHRLQHILDLGTPASRQQRDMRRFRQGRPHRVVIGRIESLGMPDEAGMHAKRREIVRLERKQAEQTVDGARDAATAPAPHAQTVGATVWMIGALQPSAAMRRFSRAASLRENPFTSTVMTSRGRAAMISSTSLSAKRDRRG